MKHKNDQNKKYDGKEENNYHEDDDEENYDIQSLDSFLFWRKIMLKKNKKKKVRKWDGIKMKLEDDKEEVENDKTEWDLKME